MIWLFLLNVAFARCGSVDLSSRFGPVRDQHGTDWCGSAVAADLLSYYAGVRLSMVSIGVNYYAGRTAAEAFVYDHALGIEPGHYGGASLASALNVNLGGRACREDEWPDHVLKDETRMVFDKITALRLGRMTKRRCSVDLRQLHLRPRGYDWWPNAEVSAIHRQLSRRNPVAAVVEMDRLFDLGPPSDAWAVKTFGDHYVIIAGRRNVGGRCQLLVRNSWGPDCGGYGTKGIASCDGGQLWIDEAQVRASLKTVIHLEPPRARE